MPKAFLSIDYKSKKTLSREIDSIVNILNDSGFNGLIFVNKFFFLPSEEKKMMDKALKEIKKSDILIAEVSKKAIGVGIEIGYAKALLKPIIYLKKCNSEYSTTVAGVSDYIIAYSDINHLENELRKTIKDIKSKLFKNARKI